MSTPPSPTSDSTRRRWPARWRAAGAGALALSVGALTFLPVTAGAAPDHHHHVQDTLLTGQYLRPGHMLRSDNLQYRLVMQTDGNLVEYKGPTAMWQSYTNNHPGAFAILQKDGNFVVYSGKTALFNTKTYEGGGPDNRLVMQSDGNVVIYNGTKPLWWTDRPPPTLAEGSTGSEVVHLQQRLQYLHYWVGTFNGVFGDSTEQAVWAFQKAAGLDRSGVVGPATWAALNKGVEPTIRPHSGNLIEVNLGDDLLVIIQNGKLWATVNTSTGGGYTYVENGVTNVATTPQGTFNVYREVNGTVTDSLGTLWRPKFFTGGYAIHGDGFVPPYPASHGCVRVSNEAINWIWAKNLIPMGETVWVY